MPTISYPLYNVNTQNTTANVSLNTSIGYNGTWSTVSNPYIITTTGTGTAGTSPWVAVGTDSQPSSLKVRGDAEIDGNLTIGGENLTEILQKVQRRLGILKFNEELEEEFEKLQALGDEYRALEAEILEQKRVWDILKRE